MRFPTVIQACALAIAVNDLGRVTVRTQDLGEQDRDVAAEPVGKPDEVVPKLPGDGSPV